MTRGCRLGLGRVQQPIVRGPKNREHLSFDTITGLCNRAGGERIRRSA